MKRAEHFNRWNKWRKNSLNGKFYKFLVLAGVVHSPTFARVLSDKQEKEIAERIKKETNSQDIVIFIPEYWSDIL